MGGVGGGRLFEGGRLLNFSAFRMGAYSRWALIRGWALIRINTVHTFSDKYNVTGISVLNLVKMPLPTCSNCHEYARCVDDKCVCLDGYVGNGKVCEGIYES